jgi:hypothetical protein
LKIEERHLVIRWRHLDWKLCLGVLLRVSKEPLKLDF